MKGNPYEENIPNTFAPNCTNKKFSVSMIAGGLRRGFIDRKKIPPDIAKLAWAELHRQTERDEKLRKKQEKDLETYKQKTKLDSDIRYLADQYLTSRFGGPRFHGTSYWMIERICTLNTHQLKKFLDELAKLIDDEMLDRRTEENRQLRQQWKELKHTLIDEFLDAIPLGTQAFVIDKICNLDDSKNELLSFLSGTIGCIHGFYKDKTVLKDLRSNQRHII